MSEDLEYREQKIKELLGEIDSLFYEIQFKNDINDQQIENTDNQELINEISSLKENFEYLSQRLYKLCFAYIESKDLHRVLVLFESELKPFFEDENKLFSEKYYSESGEYHSELSAAFKSFLLLFSAFSAEDNQHLTKRIGLIYLENILQSTAVIINELGKKPKSETDVYECVRVACKATFPSAIFPSESFQKTAKCYIPDILIPSLNCAVEYKYAITQQKLITTIDEILIDVKGYDKHSTYKLFYAVFYVKPGIWTERRFNEVWEEKQFPENWKGIFVLGDFA